MPFRRGVIPLFGEKIMAIRKQKGLSRADVEREAKIPQRTLQNWETKKNSPPEWAQLLVAEKLGTLKKKRFK